jgi:Fe-S cluster assembly iron-binding protein IscA
MFNSSWQWNILYQFGVHLQAISKNAPIACRLLVAQTFAAGIVSGLHFLCHFPRRVWAGIGVGPMVISESAASRLQELRDRLGSPGCGLRFEGHLGTCHGSSPILKPAQGARPGEREVTVDGIKFFVPAEHDEVFERAQLDMDGSFMGRGLYLTWPHREGCDCECG